MAYVSVPKDLTKVKNKLVFNMTKRQLICLAVGAVMGLPFYFLTRETLGTSTAATGMVLLMLPAFLFAMYEKDGMHLEQVLRNIIRVRWERPAVRRYETENFYEMAVSRTVPAQEKKQKKPKGGTQNGKKR